MLNAEDGLQTYTRTINVSQAVTIVLFCFSLLKDVVSDASILYSLSYTQVTTTGSQERSKFPSNEKTIGKDEIAILEF